MKHENLRCRRNLGISQSVSTSPLKQQFQNLSPTLFFFTFPAADFHLDTFWDVMSNFNITEDTCYLKTVELRKLWNSRLKLCPSLHSLWNLFKKDRENVFVYHLCCEALLWFAFLWEQRWCGEQICVKDQFVVVCCNSLSICPCFLCMSLSAPRK